MFNGNGGRMVLRFLEGSICNLGGIMKWNLAALAIISTILLSGCQTNILVSNCRKVVVEGDEKARMLCDKGWSDYWK